MKIRTDFVTNSSSSSFMVALKGEVTQEQKLALADAFLCQLLGTPELTPDSSEEKIKRFLQEQYLNEEDEQEIRQALEEGETIRCGVVVFEDGIPDQWMANFFLRGWKILEKTGNGNFVGLDTDLDI